MVIDSQEGGCMGTILRDEKLTKVADSVKPDSKRRVYLPKALLKEGVTYHMYANKEGQIVLDPQVTIPAAEAWIFEDKALLASFDKSVAESAKGKVIDRGSFSKYTKDAE
jgi:hypothetical protein